MDAGQKTSRPKSFGRASALLAALCCCVLMGAAVLPSTAHALLHALDRGHSHGHVDGRSHDHRHGPREHHDSQDLDRDASIVVARMRFIHPPAQTLRLGRPRRSLPSYAVLRLAPIGCPDPPLARVAQQGSLLAHANKAPPA